MVMWSVTSFWFAMEKVSELELSFLNPNRPIRIFPKFSLTWNSMGVVPPLEKLQLQSTPTPSIIYFIRMVVWSLGSTI